MAFDWTSDLGNFTCWLLDIFAFLQIFSSFALGCGSVTWKQVSLLRFVRLNRNEPNLKLIIPHYRGKTSAPTLPSAVWILGFANLADGDRCRSWRCVCQARWLWSCLAALSEPTCINLKHGNWGVLGTPWARRRSAVPAWPCVLRALATLVFPSSWLGLLRPWAPRAPQGSPSHSTDQKPKAMHWRGGRAPP